MTRVSIVTPSFNDAAHLERTIASVVAQEGVDLEYLLIDGGSTDATPEIIERWRDRIDVVVVEPDGGQADAIRKGWDLATGDLVTWLNSDDCYSRPSSVAELVAVLDQRRDVDVVYGVRTWIAEDGTFLRRDPFRPFDESALRAVCVLPQECALMRRAAVERAGGIDPTRHVTMDYDLWLRLLESGATFLSHPRPIALFRVREGQKSSSLWDSVGLAEVNELQRRHNHGRTLDNDEMARAGGEYFYGLRPDDDEHTRSIPGALWSTVDAMLALIYRGRVLDRWALSTTS